MNESSTKPTLGAVCVHCGAPQTNEAHTISDRRDGPQNELPLCARCYASPEDGGVSCETIWAKLAGLTVADFGPIPMLLWCPSCGERHHDVGEFATKPHHTHACQDCGMVWRPAIVHTVGVRFLPGFKNEEP